MNETGGSYFKHLRTSTEYLDVELRTTSLKELSLEGASGCTVTFAANRTMQNNASERAQNNMVVYQTDVQSITSERGF
jgi:hypothetical protein